MYPLMYLFGKNSMPDVDNLLTSFYQLDDEARQEVVETIRLKLQYHRDPEPVSYTHLDVYKRQQVFRQLSSQQQILIFC